MARAAGGARRAAVCGFLLVAALLAGPVGGADADDDADDTDDDYVADYAPPPPPPTTPPPHHPHHPPPSPEPPSYPPPSPPLAPDNVPWDEEGEHGLSKSVKIFLIVYACIAAVAIIAIGIVIASHLNIRSRAHRQEAFWRTLFALEGQLENVDDEPDGDSDDGDSDDEDERRRLRRQRREQREREGLPTSASEASLGVDSTDRGVPRHKHVPSHLQEPTPLLPEDMFGSGTVEASREWISDRIRQQIPAHAPCADMALKPEGGRGVTVRSRHQPRLFMYESKYNDNVILAIVLLLAMIVIIPLLFWAVPEVRENWKSTSEFDTLNIDFGPVDTGLRVMAGKKDYSTFDQYIQLQTVYYLSKYELCERAGLNDTDCYDAGVTDFVELTDRCTVDVMSSVEFRKHKWENPVEIDVNITDEVTLKLSRCDHHWCYGVGGLWYNALGPRRGVYYGEILAPTVTYCENEPLDVLWMGRFITGKLWVGIYNLVVSLVFGAASLALYGLWLYRCWPVIRRPTSAWTVYHVWTVGLLSSQVFTAYPLYFFQLSLGHLSVPFAFINTILESGSIVFFLGFWALMLNSQKFTMTNSIAVTAREGDKLGHSSKIRVLLELEYGAEFYTIRALVMLVATAVFFVSHLGVTNQKYLGWWWLLDVVLLVLLMIYYIATFSIAMSRLQELPYSYTRRTQLLFLNMQFMFGFLPIVIITLCWYYGYELGVSADLSYQQHGVPYMWLSAVPAIMPCVAMIVTTAYASFIFSPIGAEEYYSKEPGISIQDLEVLSVFSSDIYLVDPDPFAPRAGADAEPVRPTCVENASFGGFTVAPLIFEPLRDTFAYIARGPSGESGSDIVVVNFRGTSFADGLYENAKTDLDVLMTDFLTDVIPGAQCHRGFVEAWEAVRLRVLAEVQMLVSGAKQPVKYIVCTGHSLGGALSTLAAIELMLDLDRGNILNVGSKRPEVVLCTFGQPVVGNEAFATYVEGRIRYAVRVVNGQDVVAMNPTTIAGLSRYHHVGTEVVIDVRGNVVLAPTILEQAGSRLGMSVNDHFMTGYIVSLTMVKEVERTLTAHYMDSPDDERLISVPAAAVGTYGALGETTEREPLLTPGDVELQHQRSSVED